MKSYEGIPTGPQKQCVARLLITIEIPQTNPPKLKKMEVRQKQRRRCLPGGAKSPVNPLNNSPPPFMHRFRSLRDCAPTQIACSDRKWKCRLVDTMLHGPKHQRKRANPFHLHPGVWNIHNLRAFEGCKRDESSSSHKDRPPQLASCSSRNEGEWGSRSLRTGHKDKWREGREGQDFLYKSDKICFALEAWRED